MGHLCRTFRGQINLIYIDPPFDSKADYKRRITLRGASVLNDRTAFEEKQYGDLWTNDEYLQFMYERLVLMRELLAKDGSIYLHCDFHRAHHLRLICDEVFGPERFQREIIWRIGWISGYKSAAKNWIRNHETILFYTRSESFTFNKAYIPYPPDYVRRDGSPPSGEGYPIEDTWNCYEIDRMDSIQIMSFSGEKVGYPTQKNENLIERIVRASSRPGDLVFDCFMGSGTTQAVAARLGRRFIGADINLGAVQTTTKRLLALVKEQAQVQPNLSGACPDGDDPRPVNCGFDVFTVNHYDVFRNELEARALLMEAFAIRPLNAGETWHGELGEGSETRVVRVMPVNRIATKADLAAITQNLDYKALAKRRQEQPTRPIARITLLCMGHEPDLGATLTSEIQRALNDMSCKVDVEVVDVLRDKTHIQLKLDSEAKVTVKGGKLRIEKFYPMNLLQKLSLEKATVGDWRELVESVFIDFNYDGVVLRPLVTDSPEGKDLVKGEYPIPDGAATVRVKIMDVLSDVFETSVEADGG